MWRNKKMVVIAVMAAVLLAAGIGGVVNAKTDGTATGNTVLNQAGANVTSGNDTLMARVARIIGIDQQKLQDAVKQARGDMQSERLDTYLKNLVDQGKITQAQADAFKTWWQSRPTSDQTTIQQYKDWLAARPADVPLPRRVGGAGICGGADRDPGPVRGDGMMSRGGMMGRF